MPRREESVFRQNEPENIISPEILPENNNDNTVGY